MDDIPIWAQATALVLMLLASAFFSIAETSMMALNKLRLAHLTKEGRAGAALTSRLLESVERLLSTILLGNNLANTALTAVVTALAIRYFGNHDSVLAIATAVIATLIIIFCEITPKVIGATYPERIALVTSYPLAVTMKIGAPVVWMLNQITSRLLRLVGIDTSRSTDTRLSADELRSIVIDTSRYMPAKHRAILMNLFDLEAITVDDIMTPRAQVEALDIAGSRESIIGQLTTCYHNKLPVFEGELNRVVGILHVRRTLAALDRQELDRDEIRALLTEPYFIPSGTALFTQLQFFQDTRRRVGLVVDEYGEVLGLVTLEDIIEEIIGEFTTQAPTMAESAGHDWIGDEATADGRMQLRELNRRLGIGFALDGPKTLSGWMIETLREMPDGPVSVRHGDAVIEALSMDSRTIRSFRLQRLNGAAAPTDGNGERLGDRSQESRTPG
ncbi:MAG: CNNM domain-containing protein [Burkholderiaceae bacterium]